MLMSELSLDQLFTQRFGETPSVPKALSANSALQRIASRGSCRRFTSQPVDPAMLEALCAAALCAPSKSDLQQRDILIVTDPLLLQNLKSQLSAQHWIENTPAMVVFLANNRRQRQMQSWHNQPFPNDHLDAFFNASVDAGIALAFFMAAAEMTGLGCCPISTIRNHMSEVQKFLRLPDHVFPIAGMAIGHPAQPPTISARLPLSKTVHLNEFSDVTPQDLHSYDERRLDGADEKGWSADKAEMYALPQRVDFADFIRSIGFSLD